MRKIELLRKCIFNELPPTPMTQWVWEDISDKAADCAESGRMAHIISAVYNYTTEIQQYGCISGIVSSLIYYRDTNDFFDIFKDEIIEKLDEIGYFENAPDTLHDFLVDEVRVKNNLAWAAFEITAAEIQNYICEKFISVDDE